MSNNNIKIEKRIQGAIVRAIVFFDLFDFPLTHQEIWKYSNVKCDPLDIIKALKDINLDIKEKNGFYFLAGREEIIKTRMERYNFTDKKFKRAILISKIFKIVPWIKMIAIGNIIGEHNLKKEGDIDFFVITEKNRVWITRFFCVAITKLLRIRPTPKNAQDKICLSFFISEEVMDLKDLMLDREIFDSGDLGEDALEWLDLYFIYWLACLIPIYNVDSIYKNFIDVNNWIKVFLPNWRPYLINNRRNAGSNFCWLYHDIINLFFGEFDKKIRKFQLKKMPHKLKIAMNRDSKVIVRSQILKFHSNDRRAEYREKFNERIRYINEKFGYFN